jgi:hypothetical protein
LENVVSTHPGFDSVEDYVEMVLMLILAEEKPTLDDTEVEAISERLAALGYM